MSARAHSRQRSLSNQRSIQSVPYSSKARESTTLPAFEPCAATGSLFLYAEGSTVLCLHHDTLALERKFEKHTANIQFICVDNVSERGQGRLVVTYDVGQTAIVWDLLSGDQISRFASFEPLTAAAWMRNGNLTFGNEKGEIILFEPSTSEHVSARTIFDPITAIAPSSDCRTFAIGFRNGSILLATLQPVFTILHTLSTSRAPSQISALSWHASSSKQKSDMLATNTIDGDLRVWSVAKPASSAAPRVIRSLHRSDAFTPSQSWIAWSKNGRILQLYEGVTWSWDVRTKDVTYLSIPTVEYVRGIAAYGPTGTLFTLGPDYTIQQYDVDTPQMVANVRHPPRGVPQTPPQHINPPSHRSGSENEYMSPRRELRYGTEPTKLEPTRVDSYQSANRRSDSYAAQPPDPRSFGLASPPPMTERSATTISMGGPLDSRSYGVASPPPRTERSTTTISVGNTLDSRSYGMTSPPPKTERSTTTMSMGAQSQLPARQYSPSPSKAARKTSRLKQEVIMSPVAKPVAELFPYTRTRSSDVPYQQPRTTGDTSFTPDDLRKQMLNVVFGWKDDIHSLINDELSRHPPDSQNAIFLARWLGLEPDGVADIFKTTKLNSPLDWMRLALHSIDTQPSTKKMAQAFTQKLLEEEDIHAAVCLLIAIGEYNDAVEVYVSQGFHMEAILLTCLLMPSDWHRQAHLVRTWGDHAKQQSQQHLAMRCYSCINVEPTDPWTSPTAQTAAQASAESVQLLQPSIFHKTMERRGIQDPSPQTDVASPVSLPNGVPGRARQGSLDGGLKLITSFGGDSYKFPGLMSDEGTPINQALITPIVDSALPRSAVSPGPYKINNMRSLNGALARTGTPGTAHRNRLPSIGESPVDLEQLEQLEQQSYQPGLVPRPPPTPADSGSDKEKGKQKEKERSIQIDQDRKAAQEQLPALLTPARYDPKTPLVSETPQTAVASQSSMTFTETKPLDIQRPASARPRGTSRSRTRKPDGLSVSTTSTHQSQSSQEVLRPAVYGDSIQRPATTTGAFHPGRSEMSPPNTGNSLASLASLASYRSMRSPTSLNGRSLDQYISSLEQAQYYKSSRSRGNSVTSKQSRDEYGESKYKNFTQEFEDSRSRSNSVTVAPTKRSPSSPVPMSPGELRKHTASVESFNSAYLSTPSFNNQFHNSTTNDTSSQAEEGVQQETRQRHRSRSRVEGKSNAGSRAASRRRSPDREASGRGRSKSRVESSSARSPESPVPMVPSEEDLQSIMPVDPALKFVAQNRQRLSRSSNRREPSTDRRGNRMRSRSRQPEPIDTSLTRKSNISVQSERHRQSEQSSDSRQVDSPDLRQERLSSTSEAERKSLKDSQHIPYGRRKELAQAELEARRLSLVRRPSAPAVPLPGQSFPSPPLEFSPPLIRASTDQGLATLSSFGSLASPPARPDSASSVSRARPHTPRAMKHPGHGQKSIPELPNMGEVLGGQVFQAPSLPNASSGSSQKGRSESFTSPEIPFDMPMHPAFDANIAMSRTANQHMHNRIASPARGVSRERRPTRETRTDHTVVTIGEEDYSEAEVIYASPPVVPELQHLAMPPPPPPPPVPSQELLSHSYIPGQTVEHDALSLSMTGQLPQSTYYNDPKAAISPTEYHHRSLGVNDKQLSGKIRNIAGRMRSRSRGRSQSRTRDNPTRSPNLGGDENISPYESLNSTQQAHFQLATVTENHF